MRERSGEKEGEAEKGLGKRSHRLFCAVELPAQIRAGAARYIASLRASAPEVRASWDREEKLHLTLKFFGDVEDERVTGLASALARAASLISPFELKLSGTGAFPPSGPVRVLWLGVSDYTGRLAELQQRVEDECAAAGFARERKRFHPHLTIARLRRPEGARHLANIHKGLDFETEAFNVSEIALIKSELLPQGSRYTKLAAQRMKDEVLSESFN